MKILFLRLSSLGDVILTMPIAKAFKQKMPGATVDLGTKLEYKDLFVPPSPFNKIIYLDDTGIRAFIKKINEQGYDIIIDFHGSVRTGIAMPFLNAASKKRYKKGAFSRRLFAMTGIRISPFPSVLERYAGALNIKEIPDAPWFHISDKDVNAGYQILKDTGVEMDKVIGMAPGAKWGTKKWDIKRYVELARKLSDKAIDTVFVFGKGDEKDRDRLLSISSHFKVINTQDYLLREVGCAIAVMDAFISGDTGLMHLAEAAGTPLIGIFGPTTKEFGFSPSGKKSIVIEKNMSCRPCSLHGSDVCKYGHHACMEDITVHEVEAAVDGIIEQGSTYKTRVKLG